MTENSWSWTIHTSLPSRHGAHEPCVREVLAQLKQLGWAERDLFAIQMALVESLINAMRHGNRLDAKKQVDVECKANSDRFWMRVKDEGPGFQPDAVPDCTSEENLDRCCGRGLALMKAYMTSVQYNDCGNIVTMEKFRTTGPATEC
jgi:serine/threonine-protein kinase RsbW